MPVLLQENQSLLQAFENCSRSALGAGPWMACFDAELVDNLGRYRKYNQGSLRDLLRVIRNKHNHFRELPESLQAKLGPLPQGYHLCAPVPCDPPAGGDACLRRGCAARAAGMLRSLLRGTLGCGDTSEIIT